MKVCNPFLVLCTLCTGILAQNVPSQSYQLIKSKNLVQYKNHYQLALFQQVPEVRKMLEEDSVTKKVFDLKQAKANEALKNYKTDGKITKNITLDSLGACQGITYQNERYFLYGDREVGVMREYKLTNDSLIYQHKEYRFTVKGENTIKHPTGIAYHKGLPTFVGNSVKQNAAGTLWKAVINCISWDGFLKTRTLDGNLLKTIDDDTCIQGTRPEYVKYKGKWYVATADYGNKANEVRLYDPQALAKANKTSEKGVLVKKFTCSPWVQNLHWIADKGILVLIQNQIEGRKWRLTFLDLEKSVAAGHEIVLSIIDTDKPDELEGFTLTDKSEKGIAVSSSRKNNVSLMDFGWNKP